MNALALSFVENPLYYIGAAFALWAAVALLIFIRGFGPGISQLIYLDLNEEHLEKYRRRITWGTMLLVFIFIVWEIVRAVLLFVGGLFV